jgi:hypothetical protein
LALATHMRDFLLTRPLRCDAFVKAHAVHHHSVVVLGRMVPAKGAVGVCWLIFSVMGVTWVANPMHSPPAVSIRSAGAEQIFARPGASGVNGSRYVLRLNKTES